MVKDDPRKPFNGGKPGDIGMMNRIRTGMSSLVFTNLLTFALVLGITLGPFLAAWFMETRELLRSAQAARLEAAAERGAAALHGGQLAGMGNPLWYQTPEYEALVTLLAELQQTEELDHAVVYLRSREGAFVYLADGNRVAAINAPVVLHETRPDIRQEAVAVWESARPGPVRRYEAQGRFWMQVHRPLIWDGKVQALLMLNRSEATLRAALNRRLTTLGLGLALALGGGGFILGALSLRRSRTLRALADLAEDTTLGWSETQAPSLRGNSELARLSRAWLAMLERLRVQRNEVDSYRNALEQRLESQQQATRMVLEAGGAMLVRLDAAGKILPEESPAAPRLIEGAMPGADFLTLIAADPLVTGVLREALQSLRADKPETLLLSLARLPRQLRLPGQNAFSLRAQPIPGIRGQSNAELRIVLHPAAPQTQPEGVPQSWAKGPSAPEPEAMVGLRDRLERLTRFLRHREAFDLISQETPARLTAMRTELQGLATVRRKPVDQMFLELRRVASQAEFFALREAAAQAAALANRFWELHELRDQPMPGPVQKDLGQHLQELMALLDGEWRSLLNLAGESPGSVPLRLTLNRLERVREAVLDTLPPAHVAPVHDLLDTLSHVPLERMLGPHQYRVETLARERGLLARLILAPEARLDLPLDVYARLDGILEELLKNALLHGIESPTERLRVNKPNLAEIRLGAERQPGGLLLILTDDGRGVDLEAVRRAAVARELIPAHSAEQTGQAELLRLLFYPRFGTASALSHLDGRGLGLASIRSEMEAQGGWLRLTTRTGKGCTVELFFPLAI
ncbi:MAG: ATP-binding protein [Deltaproteobacteria bacterium]|nr:ATP-binding protein [Deltaproteobacteria bacterium]